MNDLISTAILIATLFGGTMAAEKMLFSVRTEALTKAAVGLPNMSTFSRRLTKLEARATTKSKKDNVK